MRSFIILLSILFSLNLSGQNLIGYKVVDIRKYMREKQRNMIFQNFTNNSTFKYLKYVDDGDSQTLLFFLNADSTCKGIRLVCEKSLESEKLKELDELYKRTGENVWTETRDGKKYNIELRRENWSISITILRGE